MAGSRLPTILAAAIAVVLMLFGWLGVGGPAAIGAPSPIVQTYTYDSHHGSFAEADTATDRGPPMTYDRGTTYNAVDLRSHGALARPDGTTSDVVCAYDHPAPLVHPARGATTTHERTGLASGESRVSSGASVAAKGAPELVKAGETCLNSFTGTTLMLMADGTKKPIKDIKLGDWVMATDPVTGERGRIGRNRQQRLSLGSR